MNLLAAGLRLQAGGSIGAAGAALETQVATLAATGATGGTWLNEKDALSVGTVGALAINRIDAAGTVATVSDAALSGLGSTGAASIVLASGGNLSIDQVVGATGSGHILLSSGGTLALNSTAGNGSGSITLLATGAISQSAMGHLVTGGGTIDVESSTGGIVMASGAMASTNGASIRYKAAGDITLGLLDARTAANRGDGLLTGQAVWGTVSVLAAGSVLDIAGDSAVDIYAAELRLAAGTSIGAGGKALDLEVSKLSASAGASLYLSDASDVTLDATAAIMVNRVKADGSISGSGVSDAAQSNLQSGAALVLQAVGTIVNGNGGLITAGGNLLLAAGVDLTLGAVVGSSGGNISLSAARDIVQNANVTAAAAGKSIDLLAGRNILMANGSTTSANNGNLQLQAVNSVTIETLAAGNGSVLITATGGAIADHDVNGDSEVDITAAALSLSAGTAIGSGANHLEINVTTLTARSGAGGLFLAESDGLTVAAVTAQVNRVGADGASTATSNAAQDGLASTAAGAIVLQSASGNLLVSNSVTAAGNGNILLQAAGGSLTLNAAVGSTGGFISLAGATGIAQNANLATTGGGSIELLSGAAISMADGSTSIAVSGNLRYVAAGALTLGALSTGGNVSLAAASIADSGSTDTDVRANELRIVSSGTTSGVGTAAAHLQLAVNMLAANVAGSAGLYLDQSGALVIGALADIGVSRVGVDGTLSAVTDSGIADLVSGGNLVLNGASITLQDGDNNGRALGAAGNLLLNASGDLLVLSNLVVGGNISLAAGNDLRLGVSIAGSGAGHTVDLRATRDVLMQAGTSVTSGNGNIALQGGRNVALTLLDAGSGNVSVQAVSGGISDMDGAAVNVLAAGLQLRAGGAIGDASNPLEISVATLAAQAGADGMYLLESDGLTVDTLTVQVNRVDGSGNATATANAPFGNLSTSGAGNIVLRSTSGDLTVSDDVTVGSGNILLQAVAGNLTLNSAIQAGSGSVSLSAAGFIAQKAAISTAGSVDLQAGGAITMDDGVLTSATGNIRYVAGSTLTLGALSTSGNVSLSAERISDSGGNDTDVTANQLRLVTTGAGAGTGTAHLQVAVNTLAANVAGSGGLFLDATQDITVDAVGAIGVSRLAADGTVSLISDASLSDLVSGGALVLVGAGTVTVNDGNGNLNGVTAAGNLLLQAATDLVVNAALLNNGANISLNAGRDLLQNAAVTTTVAGASIELAASGKLTMANGAVSNSNNGNMVLLAGTNATLTVLNAGNGSVSITAGNNIVDGAGTGAGTGAANVIAAGLLLHAGNGIGEGANALDTTVSTLTAHAGNGGLYLSESDGLTVSTVQVQVNRVGADGAATVTANAAQGMLTASAAGNVVLLSNSGDLVINNTVGAVSGSVLLQASAGNLTLNSAIQAGSGSVSLSAAGFIAQKAAISTAGSVDLQAGGAITMDDGVLTSATGNIRYVAGSTLTLGASAPAAMSA